LDTTVITYKNGVSEGFFTISAKKSNDSSEIIDTGTLNFQLIGVNQDVYSLPATNMDFHITSSDLVSPILLATKVIATSQTSANISINTSEPCLCFYMVALNGTESPNISNLLNKGPSPPNTTLAFYGTLIIRTAFSSGDSSIYSDWVQLTNLLAQTPYVFYFILQDQGFNLNTQLSKIDFITSSTAFFSFLAFFLRSL